jgi:hypothetical protein
MLNTIETMDSQEFTLIIKQFDSLQSSISTQFGAVNDRLDKVNGRIGKTEDEIKQIIMEKERMKEKQENGLKQIDDLWIKVEALTDSDNKHFLKCPVVPMLTPLSEKIRKLEDANLLIITRSGLIKSALATLALFVTISVGLMKLGESHTEYNHNSLKLLQDTIMRNQTIIHNELQILIKNNKDENTK